MNFYWLIYKYNRKRDTQICKLQLWTRTRAQKSGDKDLVPSLDQLPKKLWGCTWKMTKISSFSVTIFRFLEHTVEMERGGFHYHQTIFGKWSAKSLWRGSNKASSSSMNEEKGKWNQMCIDFQREKTKAPISYLFLKPWWCAK